MSGLPAFEDLGNGQVLLRGPALLDAARLMAAGASVAERRDGITMRPGARRMLEAVTAAAAVAAREMSASGHADVRDDVDEPESGATEIGTLEAAQILGLTERQVRRMTEDLEARRRGDRWVFDRDAVTAVAMERQQDRSTA